MKNRRGVVPGISPRSTETRSNTAKPEATANGPYPSPRGIRAVLASRGEGVEHLEHLSEADIAAIELAARKTEALFREVFGESAASTLPAPPYE